MPTGVWPGSRSSHRYHRERALKSMIPINNFSLEAVADKTRKEQFESRLVFDGKIVGCVNGLILEKQFKTNNGYLLLNTYDNPYEETLSISYFSPTFEILDNRLIFGYYSTGMLKDIRVINEHRLRFFFFKDTLWELTILRKPKFVVSQWGLSGYILPHLLLMSILYEGRFFQKRYLKLEMLGS